MNPENRFVSQTPEKIAAFNESQQRALLKKVANLFGGHCDLEGAISHLQELENQAHRQSEKVADSEPRASSFEEVPQSASPETIQARLSLKRELQELRAKKHAQALKVLGVLLSALDSGEQISSFLRNQVASLLLISPDFQVPDLSKTYQKLNQKTWQFEVLGLARAA